MKVHAGKAMTYDNAAAAKVQVAPRQAANDNFATSFRPPRKTWWQRLVDWWRGARKAK
jgi:hypothetical protein